jgi:predicted nucleic acid-binding Zn ribbon protein
MPTYVYKFVETGETIEVQQGFHDDNLTEIAHPDSGEVLAVKKVFTPVGVTFKGSGFFKTDNRGKQSATSTASSGTKESSDSGSSGSSGSSESSASGTSSRDTTTSTTTASSSSSGASSSGSSSSSSTD